MQFVRIHRRFPYTALSPIGAHCVPMGLNPYREIVFRSTFQIAGARTVNRLFSPFSDVRKKKGLRIFRRLFHADAQNWFFVVLLRGLLWGGGRFLQFSGRCGCLPGAGFFAGNSFADLTDGNGSCGEEEHREPLVQVQGDGGKDALERRHQ